MAFSSMKVSLPSSSTGSSRSHEYPTTNRAVLGGGERYRKVTRAKEGRSALAFGRFPVPSRGRKGRRR